MGGKTQMEVRVLGPVEAWSGGTKITLARRQQRLMLGVLALEANRLVSRDQLVQLLWGEQPPQSAYAVIHSRMSEIRTAVAAGDDDTNGRLATRGSGYILHVEPESVDAHRFTAIVSAPRSPDSDEHARVRLREALGLWRGPVLGGWLPDDSYSTLCQGLEAARLTAMENLFDVELRLGNHLRVVDEILATSVANPTRERLTGQMMLALHRAGRTVEALHAYDRWRRWLSDELGIDPGSDIQSLHLAILHGDTELERSDAASTVGSSSARDAADEGFSARVPQTLPHDIADFSGREHEVAHLRSRVLRRNGSGVSVTTVAGPGGAGKTALALHVAHQVREEFPHGQLYATLRGIDDDGPAEPVDVLGRFLRALGVDHAAMPETLDDRVDLYRDLLAGRRVLVVLDNAASDEQVVPLIPGSPTCSVLVNSRARLGATFSAETLKLDVMEQAESEELLTRIVGTARAVLEPQAVADLARRCGHLPLALRIAGAKLASKPHWAIRKMVGLLDAEHDRLNRLKHGNLDVRSSIALSYTGLASGARRLLRRLGTVNVLEIGVWLSAALLDDSLDTAEECLEELLDAQLIEIAGPDADGRSRYRLHDLVRLFAQERDTAEEPSTPEVAGARAVGACLFLAEAAYRALNGGDFLTMHGAAARWAVDGRTVAAVADDPLRWFEIERPTIVALIRRSAKEGWSEACWDLTCTTSVLFPLCGYHDEWLEMLNLALNEAQRAGDAQGTGAMLYRLGILGSDRQELDWAEGKFRLSVTVFEQAGDRRAAATVSAYLAMIDRFRGRTDAALLRYEAALEDLSSFADLGGEAFVLRGMGQAHMDLGDYPTAEHYLGRSLTIFDNIGGSPTGRAQVLFWRGMLRLKQERADEARTLFEEVLDLTRASSDRYGQAQSLRGIGLCYQSEGYPEKAQEALSEALRIVSQPRPTLVEAHVRKTLAEIDG
jgi:DNA-binding SARP family transcriptional activator